MAVFSRNVPNSAAAVCYCWILVLQIPEIVSKMAGTKIQERGLFYPPNSGGHTRHGGFQQERSEFGCRCLLPPDSCFADS
jgi:hypothetical protein